MKGLESSAYIEVKALLMTRIRMSVSSMVTWHFLKRTVFCMGLLQCYRSTTTGIGTEPNHYFAVAHQRATIFHSYISYHSSSPIYVDLIAPVANVICYYTTSTINKYFLSYLILSIPNCLFEPPGGGVGRPNNYMLLVTIWKGSLLGILNK